MHPVRFKVRWQKFSESPLLVRKVRYRHHTISSSFFDMGNGSKRSDKSTESYRLLIKYRSIIFKSPRSFSPPQHHGKLHRMSPTVRKWRGAGKALGSMASQSGESEPKCKKYSGDGACSGPFFMIRELTWCSASCASLSLSTMRRDFPNHQGMVTGTTFCPSLQPIRLPYVVACSFGKWRVNFRNGPLRHNWRRPARFIPTVIKTFDGIGNREHVLLSVEAKAGHGETEEAQSVELQAVFCHLNDKRVPSFANTGHCI